MTKTHFESFARRIKADLDAGTIDRTCLLYAAQTFADTAQEHNARFDYNRFMKACGF